MARYLVLASMLAVPKPLPIAEADTPADAVRKAREFEQKGRSGLKIGDTEAAEYFDVVEFAAKHGVR
jgi:hypothetical protein